MWGFPPEKDDGYRRAEANLVMVVREEIHPCSEDLGSIGGTAIGHREIMRLTFRELIAVIATTTIVVSRNIGKVTNQKPAGGSHHRSARPQ